MTISMWLKGQNFCSILWKEIIVEKCWLPTFSHFPTMFSKGHFLRGIKSSLCGKGLTRQKAKKLTNCHTSAVTLFTDLS